MKSVENNLQVVPKAKQDLIRSDDSAIKTGLDKNLASQQGLDGVKTSVTNGVVRLTGTVTSQWDRLHAAVMSRATSGVRAVNDDLKIKAAN